MKTYRQILEDMTRRGVNVDAVHREMEYLRFEVTFGKPATDAVFGAMRRRAAEEAAIFVTASELARRIRKLQPPHTVNTSLLLDVAVMIESARKARRSVPFGNEKPRRGAPSRGVTDAEKRLLDLHATKREAAALLVHAGLRHRQLKLRQLKLAK